jgi:flagellar biosynthesis/type III secretory pathway protein FliH
MSNSVIAKTNELLVQLAAQPSAQELVRQRKLALDTYRIEMGAAKEEGLEQGHKQGHKQGLAQGREEGREEGRARELREGILALAEVLGLELDEARLAQLDRASADELTALRARLRTERCWS